jgi:hypothetical protein
MEIIVPSNEPRGVLVDTMAERVRPANLGFL